VRDRRRVVDAYDLAVQLFSGQYRASGKTFLAHLCGTASVVQAAGGSVDETLAALVHAAYTEGDFGDGRRGRTSGKQTELRAVLGTEAETLVAQYCEWPWRSRIPELRDGGAGVLADWERPLAFLRLANEIEEHVDFANDYCPEHAAGVFPLADVPRCAKSLGRDELAGIAEEVAAEVAGHTVAVSLQYATDAPRKVKPRSADTRLRLRLRHFAGRVRRRLVRVRNASRRR
jgi:hypothetical protein